MLFQLGCPAGRNACATFGGTASNAAAAFTIALLKMLLVILYCMHVRFKAPLTWIFVAAGFIWLMIMVDLTLSDYLSRGAVPGVPDKSWKHGAWPAPTK